MKRTLSPLLLVLAGACAVAAVVSVPEAGARRSGRSTIVSPEWTWLRRAADGPASTRSAGIATAASETAQTTSASRPRLPLAAGYGRLALSFEPNRGQLDRRVDFFARGQGYALFLSRGDAMLALRGSGASGSGGAAGGQARAGVIRLHLVGADRRVRVKGKRRLPGRVNYLLGADRRRWRTGIPTYARVVYGDVYRGVDVVYYGSQGRLEYDFVVRPRA